MHLKGLIEDFHYEENDFVGETVESDDDNKANISESDYLSMKKDVRVFLKPKINFKNFIIKRPQFPNGTQFHRF